ncbi:hypothetical protein C8F01DRAFT_1258437 [Mycena amicta]|nr:hypothetical protein C8F01DRAFT_1258437 [Mycena amicta]
MENLPNELCDEIASYLEPSDCVDLSRTNRRLCASSARQIYRDVLLEDMDRALGCFRTLAGNSSCAQLVISLNILLDEEQALPVAFIELVEASAADLKRLEHLIIPYSTAVLSILSTAQLPCLSLCRIPPCQSAVLLLQNNPSIRTLSFQDKADSYVSQTPLDPICLPLLELFIGPQAFAEAILPHSPQTSMTLLYWTSEAGTVSLGSFLSTLQTTERVPKYLTILRKHPSPGLLSSLTPYLPKIQCLSLGFLDASSLDAAYELLEHVHESLPAMPELRQFNFTVRDKHSLRRSWFNREFDFVRKWEAYAPNLVSCTLSTGTVWCRLLPQLWSPHPCKTPSTVSEWYGPLVVSRNLHTAYMPALAAAMDDVEAIQERLHSEDLLVFGENLTRLPSDDFIDDNSQASSDDDSTDTSDEETSDADSEDENSE